MEKGMKIFISVLLVLVILGGTVILTVTLYGKKMSGQMILHFPFCK